MTHRDLSGPTLSRDKSLTDDEDPSSLSASSSDKPDKKSVFSFISKFLPSKHDGSLRETLEEALEEAIEDNEGVDEDSVSIHERALISNVLKLKDKTVMDVIVPRADITALDAESTPEELMELLADKQFSRFPVYEDNLDNIIGTVHIKDLIAVIARKDDISISDLIREVPVVSPSMPVLDMLLNMQQSRKHMAFVVDEYGGIDGLVTIGDVIESIVGDLEDEYEQHTQPQIHEEDAGSIIVDARLDVEEFEERYGEIFSEEERNDSDTLGGIVFDLAGRIPARGEVLKHDHTDMVFEVLEADARKISLIRIRNIPS